MVTGRDWPGGDPFLQRQNEPSISASSRNPNHLLAGANDYRTVDIPTEDIIPGTLAGGDAWLGVFQSLDGGLTWTSTLMPGFPRDPSCQNPVVSLRPAVCGFRGGADPTVRAGTHGLFFYSGIVFNRDTNEGAVFMARFIDLNNQENGSLATGTGPIKYLGQTVVNTGNSGQFLDKTWIAVDPRPSSGTCVIPTSGGQTQTINGGTVYLAWTKFTGSNSTKIEITWSTDCGATWRKPVIISQSNTRNQGVTIAVDPAQPGYVYAAWRRFATPDRPDAIVSSRSIDGGSRWSNKTVDVSVIPRPFDQPSSATSFRTNALPSMAVSVECLNGSCTSARSWVHVAWAQRDGDTATGDSRIFMSTSADGVNWGPRQRVDPPHGTVGVGIQDDFGQTFTRGHQFMPALTFAAGKLMLLYYDSRLTHTIARYHVDLTPEAFSFNIERDWRDLVVEGQLIKGRASLDCVLASGCVPPFVDDAYLLAQSTFALTRRHTIDVRVAQTGPGASQPLQYATVSRFPIGIEEETQVGVLPQLQFNPPNLPLFQGGTRPFIGDYIDISGEIFLPPATSGGAWTFNLVPSNSPVFHAVWTSNQDVVPPPDGDWTRYAPIQINYGQGVGISLFNGQPIPQSAICVPSRAGMRNQNIYTSRITQGLLATVIQNTKPLSLQVERAFSIVVQNFTPDAKQFNMTINNQPPDAPTGRASFRQSPNAVQTEILVTVPGNSGIARNVYVLSGVRNAAIQVSVVEAGAADPLSARVLLNPDPDAPLLVDPVGGPGQSIGTVELYNLNLGNFNLGNFNLGNFNLGNFNLGNFNLGNLNYLFNLGNFNLGNFNLGNFNLGNFNLGNFNLGNFNLGNFNLANVPVGELTYEVSNTGNTTATYSVAIIGNIPEAGATQLLVSQPNTTPLITDQNGSCVQSSQSQNVVLVNTGDLGDPDSSTFSLAPGSNATVTLLLFGLNETETEEQVENFAPATQSDAANTDGSGTPTGQLLLITTSVLSSATVGQTYTAPLEATGGTLPYFWVSLPATSAEFTTLEALGLNLNSSTGEISGIPNQVGTFKFKVQVCDATLPGGSPCDASTPFGSRARKTLILTVEKAATVTTILSDAPDPSFVGQAVEVVVRVQPAAANIFTPGGSVTVSGGNGADCTVSSLGAGAAPNSVEGSCSLTFSSAGSKSLTATYEGDLRFDTSTSAAASHQVIKADTTISINSDDPDPSIVGEPVTVSFTVSVVPPGSGTPTGTVNITNGNGTLCTANVSDGNCTFAISSVGTKTLRAVYSGDNAFNGSTSSTVSHEVIYKFTGFLSPMSAAGSCAAPSFSGTSKLGSATPLKWQLQDFAGNFFSSLSTIQEIREYAGTSCTGTNNVLYDPSQGTKGQTTLRYNEANQHFILNWDTGFNTTAGFHTVIVRLDDGRVYATVIELKP